MSSKVGVAFVIGKSVSPDESGLFVIADSLQAYSSLASGKQYQEEIANRVAQQEGRKYTTMISRVLRQLKFPEKKVQVKRFSEMRGEGRYALVSRNLENYVENERDVGLQFDRFIRHHLKRLGRETDEDSYSWERRYLFEGVAMSIYITEILGYSRECGSHNQNPIWTL